jgi:hypothetical protein
MHKSIPGGGVPFHSHFQTIASPPAPRSGRRIAVNSVSIDSVSIDSDPIDSDPISARPERGP